MNATGVDKRVWFLSVPVLWFALGWASTGILGAILLGLISFVAGALVFLLMLRAPLRGAAVLGAFMALVGPVGYDLVRNPHLYFKRTPPPSVEVPCPKDGCLMIDYLPRKPLEAKP